MIKTIPVRVDDNDYNIIEFSADQAARIQLKLMGLFKDAGVDVYSNLKLDNWDSFIALLANVNEDKFMDLLNILFKNIRSADPEKKSNPHLAVTQFPASQLMTVYKLGFECLKANFTDFFSQIKSIGLLSGVSNAA